jgi:hypothetical protein
VSTQPPNLPSLQTYYPTNSSSQAPISSIAVKTSGGSTFNYNYSVLSNQTPINGTGSGLALFFNLCQSALNASVFILPPSIPASQIGSTIQTFLQSSSGVPNQPDIVRINLGDSINFLSQTTTGPASVAIQNKVKSIAWGSEGALATYCAN